MKMKLYALTIHGKKKKWSFPLRGTPADARAWIRDGLDVKLVVEPAVQEKAGD